MNHAYPMTRLVRMLAAFLAGVLVVGSLAGADANADTNEGSKPAKEPKGATTIVVDQPIARVHQAAVNAMAVVGCKLRKNQETYLEGKRSNKVGLMVGSGGETIKIWLTADGPDRTTLKVATAKSMVGYAGQRSWNAAIVEEINKELAAAADTPAASDS